MKLLARPRWAADVSLVGEYERTFAATVTGDPSLPALAFWRGRVGLWAILQACLERPGEVLVPAYTCDMVPAAIRFAGGRCRYMDVEAGGYLSPPEQVAASRTPATRAVLCQHTYGIPADVNGYLAAAQDTPVVEDRCQLVSPPPGPGPAPAAAFYSTQWNKPFSTGLGGMTVMYDRALNGKVRAIREGFSTRFDRARSRSLAVQLFLHRLSVRPSTRAAVATAYRWAQRTGRVRGTTSAAEYGRTVPEDYLAGATNVQAALGLEQLRRWPSNVDHRRQLTGFYLERLVSLGLDVGPLWGLADRPVLWTVPVLVENRSDLLARAARSGLPISTWFLSLPTHIDPTTAATYDYRSGECPRSERLFMREVHLLTAPWVSLRLADRAVEFLRRYARFSA